ncbi:alpha/beta hydrolase [Haloplanus rallus]|uniref:Alpha/beta hydrolase n=1 Tax=Haloplanus rallus TaxID=1816183 RepID=A0A6B9F6G2_9EURY|nr:dienelactone hydrolase family protein [Haloplanus rallus]QGX95978.1 alpha/beta hydrolase [Haloplanus rallus]
MPTERVHLPGGRAGRASLDTDTDADALVVACPPHPRHGGDRHDARLGAVSDALPDRIDCLRFDYGPWDGGRGERDDARTAHAWAADRYDRIGLFGYSFGGGVALLTAAETSTAVAALSPVAELDDGSDVVATVPRIDAPLWVGYGTRDDTVDAAAVADAATGGSTVERFPADHFFVGQERNVGERVAAFFADVV